MLVLVLVTLFCTARAAEPDSVLPRMEPEGVRTAWAEQAKSEGVTGAAAELACRSWAPGLALCFTVEEDHARRLVTRADLLAWEVALPELEARAVTRTASAVSSERPAEVQVQGDARTYLLSAEGDGLDHASLFHPEALAARLGDTFAVGVPTPSVLIAFPLGDEELEKIVAVGIRRVWESQPDPLVPTIYTWREGAWHVWGEAKPEAP